MTHYSDSEPTSICSFFLMLRALAEKQATITNFTAIGLTRLWLEPTIYRTGVVNADHYTTDGVESGIIYQ